MTPINFTNGGDNIAGNLFTASTPKKLAFLFIQGWTGHQNIRAAQILSDMGFTSMTYDMRGNGESGGVLASLSRADFIADAVAAYDFFKTHLEPDVTIGVVGSSFGSYTAVLLSQERAVECLSLRVPATYPDKGITNPQLPQIETEALTTWRNKKVDFGQNKAFNALHEFKGNVQIIEAEQDELVPHQSVQNYADAVSDKSRLEHIVIKGAPHRLGDGQVRAGYEQALSAWAQNQ